MRLDGNGFLWVAGTTKNHPIIYSDSTSEPNVDQRGRGFLIKLNAETGAFVSAITLGSSVSNITSVIQGLRLTSDGNSAFISGYCEHNIAR
jgi:hypothetical protein